MGIINSCIEPAVKLSPLFAHFCAGELSVRISSLVEERVEREPGVGGPDSHTRGAGHSPPPSSGYFSGLQGSFPNHRPYCQFCGKKSKSEWPSSAPHRPLCHTAPQEEPSKGGWEDSYRSAVMHGAASWPATFTVTFPPSCCHRGPRLWQFRCPWGCDWFSHPY